MAWSRSSVARVESKSKLTFIQSGLRGDPYFDSFESTFIPLTSNVIAQELSMRRSGCELLRLIGPSFLVSHSIGALHPLTISNDCPDFVAGSINLEPDTIPFEDYTGNSTSAVGRTYTRDWGLTNTPLTYDPPVRNYTELTKVTVGTDAPANRSCLLQGEPARQLPELAKVPYVALTGSASPHITYDHCVVEFLWQAGVAADWIKLGDLNITGNGHFGYLELNSIDYVNVVHDWIQTKM